MMIKQMMICVAFLILLAKISPAIASMHGSAPSSLCPQGSSYADGCSGAPAASAYTVQHSNFFTSYAPQNGQSYPPQIGCNVGGVCRPPWNVAGVDYPVGIPAASVSAGLHNAATDHADLPSGCAYSSGAITCSGSASPTFNGWDFGANGGTSLLFQNTVTGTITIENSNFLVGSTSSLGFYYIELAAGSSANVTLLNNYVNGNTFNYGGNAQTFIEAFTTGTLTSNYNAYIDMNGHGLFVGPGNLFESFDYSDGINRRNVTHGEFTGMANDSGTMAQYTVSFSTFMEPTTNQGGETSHVYLSSGGSADTITNSTIDHNTFVSNPYQFTTNISGALLTVTVDPGAYTGLVAGNGPFAGGAHIYGSGISGHATILNPSTSGASILSIASPAVITWNNHGLVAGQPILFSPGTTLPTGVTSGTMYYIISAGLSANSFEFSATAGGAAISTSGSQSGTQVLTALTGYGVGGATGTGSGSVGNYPLDSSYIIGSETMSTVVNSTAAVEVGHTNMPNSPLYTDNYVDPSGSYYCFEDAGGGGTRVAPTMTGNVDMLNGSAITDQTQATCYGHK